MVFVTGLTLILVAFLIAFLFAVRTSWEVHLSVIIIHDLAHIPTKFEVLIRYLSRDEFIIFYETISYLSHQSIVIFGTTFTESTTA